MMNIVLEPFKLHVVHGLIHELPSIMCKNVENTSYAQSLLVDSNI